MIISIFLLLFKEILILIGGVVYLSLSRTLIFIIELFYLGLFNNEDKSIKYSLDNKKEIVIISLNDLREHQILSDNIDLSHFYNIEKIYDQPLIDFEYIFQEEKDIYVYDETKIEKNYYLKNNNDEINNDIFIEKENNNNKDCIEYGLSEDNQDFIVCTKYE